MQEITFRVATMDDLAALCEIRKTQLIHEGIAATVDIDHELSAFFTEFLNADRLYEVLACANDEIVAAGAVCFY